MLRRFIRYVRGIATVGSVLVFVVVGWPWADEYLGRRASVHRLESLRQEFEQLTGRETQIVKLNQSLTEKLAILTRCSLTPETETKIRDLLVEVVRDYGCRVRQIQVDELPARPWLGDTDNPRNEATGGLAVERREYSLVSSRISLTFSGSMSAIIQVVDEIEANHFLAITENLSLQPTEASGEILQMELRMRFFGIVPNDQQIADELSDDLVAGI